MPKKTNIKIFISSPQDAEKEKKLAIEACDIVANIFSSRVVLEVVEWKRNTVPLITGAGAQSVINEQITDDYDIYLGLFWKRFGEKQPNGLTPTEEEFKRALNRYEKTKKPLISVYFKIDKPSNYDKEQVTALNNFKNYVKSLGLYYDFKDDSEFRDKIIHDIGYKIENWFSLTGVRFFQSYIENKDYLKRKVLSTKDYGIFGSNYSSKSLDLLEVIEKDKRVVLLGDAGTGKTTELQRLAWQLSKANNGLVTFFLPLNKYVNEDLTELLGDIWKTNAEDKTIVVLDGLDEIEAKNKNDAIRRIELFSEQHPSCGIIISCRKNFYNQERKEETGTLNGFNSYQLLDLDYQEVRSYIEKKLGHKTDAFYDAISFGSLGGLLRVPFYLICLVKLFRENNDKLPGSKSEIFESLLNDRLKLDSLHFRTTIELERNKRTLHQALQRLGLAMNMLGRNYVSDDEFAQILPEDKTRQLLTYCTAWKRNDGDSITWQFEHNNFQEYLAAKALSEKSLAIIQEIVSFKPDHKKIVPFWANTLSFIISLPNSEPLLDWLMQIQPELMVKVEPTRLESNVKLNIFKRVFNEYKEKKVWIPFDKYNFKELAIFGQSEETADFLISEIRNASYYTSYCNAIELLGLMRIPTKQVEAKAVLMEVLTSSGQLFEKSQIAQIKTEALCALAKLGCTAKETIDELVKIFYNSQSDFPRSGLYYLIRKSGYLDDFIDIFLDGFEKVELAIHKNEKIELGLSEERRNLISGLEDAKSKESIKKIFSFMITNDSKRPHYSILETGLKKIADNAAVYADDKDIFESALILFTLFTASYRIEDIEKFLTFFDKSNTRIKAFSEILSKKYKDYINTLASLADDGCLVYFADRYVEGFVSEKEAWLFQNLLTLNNPDLFQSFNILINKKSNNKFVLSPKRDFEKERKTRKLQDTELLFDRDKFMAKVQEIFTKANTPQLTQDDVIQSTSRRWADESFSNVVFYTIVRILKKEPVTFDTLASAIQKWDWSLFCINELYRSFGNGDDLELTDLQADWVAKWCYSNLEKVNFRQALKEKDKSISTSNLAIYLWFFLRKLDLTYPVNILLDMLSFDWLEKNQMVGIEYLEERLDHSAIKKRILENLSNGIQVDDVLENHLNFCSRNKIIESIPFALSTINNSARGTDVRDAALRCLESCNDLDDIEKLALQVQDNYKWAIIQTLMEKNTKNIVSILRQIFDSGLEEDKIKGSTYLMQMRDPLGTQYYVEWVKKHKSVPETPLERLQKQSPVESLVNIESIPYLLDLLAVSYDEAFKNEIPSLHGSVLRSLTAIGLECDESYLTVREAIKKFINTHSTDINGVYFLNNFIDDLERSYYIQKNTTLTLAEIIVFLNKVLS